jgi:uncharacterized YigZ family protein
MAERYPIPAEQARATIGVMNSRFIATAACAPSVEAARELIARVRAEMPDASHHCYAFLVGYGSSVTAGMGDDGEPAGTAGRPMLDVVRGSGLGDVAVVVTRYFGGTKLGTGGLVRAYGDAAKAVLELLPRIEKIERLTICVLVSYTAYTVIRRLLDAYDAQIISEEFATDVQIELSLPADALDSCRAALAEASAGQALVEVISG